MPPLVIDVMESFRASLLRADEAAIRQMAARWLDVERQLQAQVDALALEIAAQEQPITMYQLSRLRRYQTLREQVAAQMSQYGAVVEADVRRRQLDAGLQAIEQSSLAIQATAADAGIPLQFDRLPVSSVERMVGLAGNGSPLRAVLADAGRLGPDALANELIRGVALGLNPREIARRAMRQGLATSYTRMMTIARTEVIRVARQTTQDNFRHSKVVRAYRRVAAKSRRTCLACLALDGREYALDVPFEEHPNGRCSMIPVLIRGPRVEFETGPEWFARQPEEVQRSMMGPSRYAAWSTGKLSFDDMIQRTHSPVWGDSITEKSVRALGIPVAPPKRAARSPRVSVPSVGRGATSAGRRSSANVAPVELEARRLQYAWVHGSNTRDGVLLKEAVKAEFGINNRMVMNPRGHAIAAESIASARPAVREMYNKTQAYFRERGITEVKLYRGVKSRTNVHGVIEAWTTDIATARKFNGHAVMEKTVPVEKVLLAYDGPGWRNGRYGQQYEYVTMP